MIQQQVHPTGEPACKHPVARVGRISTRKNSTKSGNAAVAFVLPIDDRYRLTADEYAWRIERRKGKCWRAIEWHVSVEAAVNSLGRRLVRTSQVTSLPDALDAVNRVACTLKDALEPSFKLEARS